MQEADEREPRAPEQNLVHVLHVEHAEHEDELVEHVVPELIFDALGLRHAKAPEHQALDEEAEQRQRAVRHVDHRLWTNTRVRLIHKKVLLASCLLWRN